MENAHLRMGILEYDRQTEKTATRVRVRVSHYIGEEESAHLVSVFGNDSDVGAVAAAVYEQALFRLTFPDGKMQEVALGEGATCCRGSISIPGRKQSVRHMIALSEELRGLKSLSRTFLLRSDATEAWTAIVHRLGLSAIPDWAEAMMRVLSANNRIVALDGIGVAQLWFPPAPRKCLSGWTPNRRRRASVSREERVYEALLIEAAIFHECWKPSPARTSDVRLMDAVLRKREQDSGRSVPVNAASADDIFKHMSAYMEAPAS